MSKDLTGTQIFKFVDGKEVYDVRWLLVRGLAWPFVFKAFVEVIHCGASSEWNVIIDRLLLDCVTFTSFLAETRTFSSCAEQV